MTTGQAPRCKVACRRGRTRPCDRRRPCREYDASNGLPSDRSAASSELCGVLAGSLMIERLEPSPHLAAFCSRLAPPADGWSVGCRSRHEAFVDQRHRDLRPVDVAIADNAWKNAFRCRAAGNGKHCRSRSAIAGKATRRLVRQGCAPVPRRWQNCAVAVRPLALRCSRARCGRRARSARSTGSGPRCPPYSPEPLPGGFPALEDRVDPLPCRFDFVAAHEQRLVAERMTSISRRS
jgi:hypothetical protein